MVSARHRKIILLGMMSTMPVAGVAWVVVQYLVGFQRLGYDVYYVEEPSRTPTGLMEHSGDDASARAAAYIAAIMQRLDLGAQWAFHSRHDGRHFGMSEGQLRRLYRSAAAVINLHGGTEPRPEFSQAGCLIYLETDPVELQIELHEGKPETIDFLAPHAAFFTWGANYGGPDCKLPVTERFRFRPTLPPVVPDLWQEHHTEVGEILTTIGNWRQPWRTITFQGEVYHWSKHHEFLKFLDLPSRVGQKFELALSRYDDEDRQMLEAHGWRVRNAQTISADMDSYRQYITGSRGEFTVAKDQNVRLRSGWFSERSAVYLASGRPVITQETGFSNILPTGEGLFGFSTMADIVEAVERINADYAVHSRAAASIAQEHFTYDVVLRRLLAEAGL